MTFLLPKASSRRPAAAWQQARRKTAQEKAGQHNRMAQEKDEDAADQCTRQCQKERAMWDSVIFRQSDTDMVCYRKKGLFYQKA